MRLHETIRARRIELGMTQDQLARQVGVSAPAVNKWEKAASYPDITLLPVLARTLGLDMNALLDFHRDLSREEVAAFVNALAEAAGEQGVEQAFQLTRDKLREYPGNDLLALSAAQVLDGALLLWAEGEHPLLREEVMALYRRCVDSPDPQIGGQARRVLISRHMARGDLSLAEELLAGLPEEDRGRPVLEAQLRRRQERWDEAWIILEGQLFRQATDVYSTLSLLMDLALDTGDREAAWGFTEAACAAGGALHLWPYLVASAHFHLAVAEKDAPAALAALGQMLRGLTEPWTLQDSPLYRHIPVKEGAGEARSMMLRPLLESLEKDPACGFLHPLPEYQALLGGYLRGTE